MKSADTVLEFGQATAIIGHVGARLLELRVAGQNLTQPITDDLSPSFCAGIVLAPWPNRIRDGRWSIGGHDLQLDITEPSRSNALHGLLSFSEYHVVEQSKAEVTLRALIPRQHGWPFVLDTWVRYRLAADGIVVTHGAENLGSSTTPFAVGAHPYLRVGDVPVEDLTLTVASDTYLEVDSRLNPVGLSPVGGSPFDVRSPRPVSDLDLDTAFGPIDFVDVSDGRGTSAWLEAPDGRRTMLRQDVGWRWVQVFTTTRFPTPAGLISAIAVEPMSAAPDSLNSGDGLIWLSPRQKWQGGWELRMSND